MAGFSLSYLPSHRSNVAQTLSLPRRRSCLIDEVPNHGFDELILNSEV